MTNTHSCAGVMIVIWNIYGYFQWPSRVCAYYRTKETCLVNVHYSSCDIICYSMAGAQWRLLWWNTSLCFYGYSKSLFCPCLLVKCPAVFHSWLSDVLKGRGGTALRAALHQGLSTAVWREGRISDTKGKHTYLVWDKGCPGQLSKGLNSPFVCTQLEDH